MSLIFQTSLSKANWKKEKAILVEAGLITEWLDNTWVRFRIGWDGNGIFTAHAGYTNNLNVIITAKQISAIVLLHKLNPRLTEIDLLKSIKLNQRNKHALSHTKYKDFI